VLVAREQAQTKDAWEAEKRQRALADDNFQQARGMLDFFTQVSAEELADKPGAQEVRRKLLEAALEYYQGFIARRGEDPSVREELVQSQLRVATILHEIGDPPDAVAALEKACRFQEKLVRDHPRDAMYRRGLSSLSHNLDWLRRGSQVLLLQQPSVQKELNLSADQVRQVNRLAHQRRAAFWESCDLSREESRTRFEELAAQERALVEGLRPEQAGRLRQIAWQRQGPGALHDPEVAAALGLTNEQKQKIRAIEAHRPPWGPHRPGGPPGWGPGGPHPRGRPKPEDLWRGSWGQLLSVLTAEQKAKWKELTGEPFKGEVRPPHPGGVGPRPNPRKPKGH
jgi:hypothetical protein